MFGLFNGAYDAYKKSSEISREMKDAQLKWDNEWKNVNKGNPGYQYYNKEQPKMTREEANTIYRNNSNFIDILVKLGLLKFDEPKKIQMILEMDETGRRYGGKPMSLDELKAFNSKYGVIRLEEWPEGLVLWVGGEIRFRWRSWGAPLPK